LILICLIKSALKNKAATALGVVFMKGKKPVANINTKIPEQGPLIILLAESGLRGLVRAPHEPEACERLYHEYADFLHRQEHTDRELIANRTLDEDLQEKIAAALLPFIVQGNSPGESRRS
jgi:hypothetical protein